MKAENLRTTNLVSYNGFEWAVTAIDLNKLRLSRLTEKGSEIVAITDDKAEGIPLDEQWLLKFGAKKYENYVYSDKSQEDKPVFKINNYLIKYEEDYQDWGICQMKGNNLEAILRTDIKHVHELQNLIYSLTGKELTLNK